jgi:hypothetical protein
MEKELSQLYASVLERYRAPGRHHHFNAFEQAVPPGFSGFLNGLLRPEERLSEQAGILECSVEELSVAGYEYIRELLFAEKNNHYQMLGLSIDSDRDQIRRRYRLLIGLFHPDRMAAAQPWEEQAVRRLNLGYGILKHPEKRSRYDADLRREQKKPAPNRQGKEFRQNLHKKRQKPPAVTAVANPADALYRVAALQRHPKLFVWMGIGLTVVFMMLLTVVDTSDNALTLSESASGVSNVSDLVPDSPLLPEKDWRLTAKEVADEPQPSPMAAEKEQIAAVDTISPEPVRKTAIAHIQDTVTAPLPETARPVQEEMPGKSPLTVSSSKKMSSYKPESKVPKPVEKKKTGLALQTSTGKNELSPEIMSTRGFDGAALPEDTLSKSNEAATVTSPEKKSKIDTVPSMQPEYVLMQYVRAYESGDMNKLLHLFTLDVQTNTGQGRKILKDSYGQLFDATRRRHFTLKQLKINPVDENRYVAWAEVAAHTISMQDESDHQYSGEILFELLPKGKRLYINKITHNIQIVEH